MRVLRLRVYTLHSYRDGLEQAADPVNLQGYHVEASICVRWVSESADTAAPPHTKTMATAYPPTTPHLWHFLWGHPKEVAGLEKHTRES
jgi:hypothetical protein